MKDRLGRNIDYIRISVTDKCNLRCKYCMPEGGICSLPHEDILEYEEIARVVRIFAHLGIKKVKLTGGEPLIRKDFSNLVKMIDDVEGIETISVTTNGVYLNNQAEELYAAGVKSVNISLDTLDSERFKDITRRDEFTNVYEGLKKALDIGMKVKLNTVITRELNYNDMYEIAKLAKDYPIDVRFIELMPIGCGKELTGIANEEILEKLSKKYGDYTVSKETHGNGPAKYVDFDGFKGSIGFISPMSHKFCSECNRIRLTAEGRLKLCLHFSDGIDVRTLLRSNKTDEEIEKIIEDAIWNKPVSHTFNEDKADNEDTRKMVQIGG